VHKGGERAPILFFFLASGAAGLILQVVWARVLGIVFGNTVYAASIVLAAFMLGLALGSLCLGRLADRAARPLALYGILELGIGGYALAFPFLASAALDLYAWFYHAAAPGAFALNAARFLLAAALLMPPTFLMGGTLPALGRHLALRSGKPAREVGGLYGINTLGALLGCVLAGFVLIRAFGVSGTLFCAGGLALLVGGAALAMGLRARMPPPPKPASLPARPPRTEEAASRAARAFIMAAFAITGFCAFAAEVLWTRILLFVLATTAYSFATMLATILAGIGLGSLLAVRFILPRLKRPLLWFGVVEILAGLAILASMPLLARLGAIDLFFTQRFAEADASWILFVRLLDAAAVLFAPCLLMGMAFPMLASACLRGDAPLGARIGRLYAANTAGCVLGASAAGFVLLPLLGTAASMLVIVVLSLLTGFAAAWSALAPRARLVLGAPAAALAAAAVVLTPSDIFHATINTFHHPSTIIFLEEHPAATVSVHEFANGERLIAADGINVAGLDFMLRTTQKLQGYIPLLLHPNPRRVVQIGFGSGETARVGLEFGVPDYTVVEIAPAVFRAGVHFEAINGGSHRDERIRRIIMDGKNFALLSREQFDIIMNDSIFPGSSGSSALYTVDHFRNCRARLAPGGLFSCWVPLDLRARELRMILKSFLDVFPHMSLWVASNCLNKHGLLLGTLEPLRIDCARIAAAMDRPTTARDLKEIAIDDVYDLLDCHVADADAIRALVAHDPVNTDDRSLLEFGCAVRPPWELCCMEVLHMLRQCRVPIAPYVTNFPREDAGKAALARRFEATNYIFEGQFAQLAGFPADRRKKFAQALAANPGEAHVRTCEEELDREIADLSAALSVHPDSTQLALRLADRLFAAMRNAEAARIYAQLCPQSPPPPPTAFVRLAEILYRESEPARAEEVLRACLRRWPRAAEAHDRLAGIYRRQGRQEEALRHSARAMELEPGNELYRRHREMIAGGR